MRLKLKGLGKTRTCKMCKQEIEAVRLFEHSKRCFEIKELENSLVKINRWLVEKSLKALKRKNKIGFDTLMKPSMRAINPTHHKNLSEFIQDPQDQLNMNIMNTRRAFQTRRCMTQYESLESSTSSKGYSQLELQEQRKQMLKISSTKYKIKEGEKPAKYSTFRKAHESKKMMESKKNMDLEDTPEEDIPQKKDNNENDDESCYGDQFESIMDCKGDGNGSSAHPSKAPGDNQEEREPDKEKVRRMRTSQTITGIEAESLVDPPMEFGGFDDNNSNRQAKEESSSTSVKNPDLEEKNTTVKSPVQNDRMSHLSQSNRSSMKFIRASSAITVEIKSDESHREDEMSIQGERSNNNEGAFNENQRGVGASPFNSPAENPPEEQKSINPIVEQKRTEFKYKSKRKESSSFYASKYAKRNNGLDSNHPDNFKKEIDMLLLAKQVYAEIAK